MTKHAGSPGIDATLRRAHDEIAASSSEAGPYLPSGGRTGDEACSARRVVALAVAILIVVGLGAVAVVSIATMGSGSDDTRDAPSSPATVPAPRR